MSKHSRRPFRFTGKDDADSIREFFPALAAYDLKEKPLCRHKKEVIHVNTVCRIALLRALLYAGVITAAEYHALLP